MAESVTDNPFFICSSGKLLWGQLHCIIEGHLANSSNVDSSAPSPSIRGTIIQHDFQYIVNAVTGEWNVKDLICRSESDGEPFISGFIIYNKDSADPVEILKECAELGMRSSRDGRIVYVNRYDWGWAHEIPDAVEQLLYGNDDDVNDDMEKKVRSMLGQRIILADASSGLAVIDQLKQNLGSLSKNALIKDTLKGENNGVIGVHLACPNTEYELGWMVFNGNKELTAFVYDGAYTGLEGDVSVKN